MKSFRTRASLMFLGISLFVLLTALTVSVWSVRYLTRSLLDSSNQFLNLALHEEVQNKSGLLMKTLAKNLYDPFYNYNFKVIESLLEHSASHEGILAIYLTDAQWHLIHTGKAAANQPGIPIEDVGIQRAEKGETLRRYKDHMVLFEPVGEGESSLGYVVADISLSALKRYQERLETNYRKLQEQLRVIVSIAYVVSALIIIGFAYSVGFLLSRRLSDPVKILASSAEKIGQGDLETDIPLKGDKEIYALASSLKNMQKRLKILRQKERKLAYFDSVTELPNRHFFHKALKDAIVEDKPFSILYFDLDDFKIINDSLGHNIGDELLAAFGNRLVSRVKQQHKIETPLYRIGGDEFVMILPGLTRRKDLENFAASCIKIVKSPFAIAGHSCRIGISIGGAIYPEHGHDEETMLKHADNAMYEAKNSGKNQLKIYASKGASRSHS